ncbi:hypothetical protein RMCBS344292_07750 [Rhizopus microsporus]|nr:hypothetical protein RMCBS344292_07750 [Rhizopus microsporus]
MPVKDSLFWIFEEKNTDDDVYLPSDIPAAAIKSERNYKLIKARHQRQVERLIAQQLQELREYDKQFTIKYNKDLFIEPTFNLIEEVDPQHFLTENADAIGHLTSFTHDGHGTQDDNNITQDKLEGRKQEYLTTLTKKHRQGFEELLYNHQRQHERLFEYQKKELAIFPPGLLDIKRTELPTTTTHHIGNSSNSKPHKEYKQWPEYNTSSPIELTNALSMKGNQPIHQKNTLSHHPLPLRIPPTVTTPRMPPTVTATSRVPPTVATSSSKAPPTVTTSTLNKSTSPTVKFSLTSKRPTPFMLLSKPKKATPTAVAPSITESPKAHMKQSLKSQDTTPSSSISSSTSLFDTNVKPSSTSLFSTREAPSSLFSANEESSSSGLFSTNTMNQDKVIPLIDKGTMRIMRNPDRVVIYDENNVETVYGNPKDYDDAIKGINTRSDNPVYRRLMKNVNHLFFKTDTGRVVIIGPVSKVRPIINAFFSSI